MCSEEVIVTGKQGVHMRPAMRLCEEAQRHNAKSVLKVRDAEVNLKSILNVLAAQIRQGDHVTVICQGEEEDLVLRKLVQILKEEQ